MGQVLLTGKHLHSVSIKHRHNVSRSSELYDHRPRLLDPTTATHAPPDIHAMHVMRCKDDALYETCVWYSSLRDQTRAHTQGDCPSTDDVWSEHRGVADSRADYRRRTTRRLRAAGRQFKSVVKLYVKAMAMCELNGT